MAQVFISYSHKDSRYAHMLADALRWQSIDVWIDDRIDYGSKWTHEIEKNLNESQAVIIILSTNSKNSEWVQNELVYAQGKKKIIFPILLEGDVWLPLVTTQYVDVWGETLPPAEFYESLKRALKDENPWGTPATWVRQTHGINEAIKIKDD